MRLLPSAALAMAMATTPAMANMHADSSGVMAFVQRLATQYLVLVSRTFVDLTYDNISVEPGTNHLIITGLTLYPELEWDTEAACEVTVDRVMTGETFSFDTAGTAIELTGVTIPPACLVPEMAGMMSSFGYNGLTADTMSIDIGYHLPTSAADIAITATIVDAADISVAAEFDYLWFRVPIDDPDDEPIPVMQLSQAEISIENAGIWERLEPMVAMQAEQMGGLEAMPQMAQQMIPQALAMGGPPSPEVEAFAQNVSQELARFLQEKNRIVVTAAPEGGVWIDEEIFDSPGNMISALQPMISSSSSAVKAIIPPADMMAAMAEGAAPDAATRLSMGEALLTGIGAPRAVDKGIAMLMPLATEWNGEAAAMIADAHAANGNAADGYRMALVALASGEASAMGTADRAGGPDGSGRRSEGPKRSSECMAWRQ